VPDRHALRAGDGRAPLAVRAVGGCGGEVAGQRGVQRAEAVRGAGPAGQAEQGGQRDGEVHARGQRGRGRGRRGRRGPARRAGGGRVLVRVAALPAVPGTARGCTVLAVAVPVTAAAASAAGVRVAGSAGRAGLTRGALARAAVPRAGSGLVLGGAVASEAGAEGDAVEEVQERQHAQLVQGRVRPGPGGLVAAGAGLDRVAGGQRGVGGQPVELVKSFV